MDNQIELYNDLLSIMNEEYEKRMMITPSYCANKMLEKGYRKIPENAVVLTREEYEELQTGQDFNYGYHNGETNMTAYYENIRLPEVRKETAEKLLNKVDYESNGQTKAITDLLRKKYGVETK